MNDLYLLLRPRVVGFVNQVRRSRKAGRRRTVLMGTLGLAFCAVLGILSCRVLIYFQSAEDIGDLLARHLLSMVLLTFFSLLIFSSIITALSNLYLSRDLELCHSLPVSLEGLFVSRMVNTFLDSSWMLIVFGVPIFLAYAYVYRPPPLFYVTLAHLIVAMGVIASAAGIVVTMLLVFVFPAQRTRDLILLLSVAMVVTLYVMLRMIRPEQLVNPDSFFTLVQYMNALKAPQSPYLPTRWITDVLWEQLTGAGTTEHLFEAVLTWTTAAALVVINVWVARTAYFEGFSKSQEAKRSRKGTARVLTWIARAAAAPFRAEMRAVIEKDVRTFFRDNTQWSQLMLLGALVTVYLYNFSVLPLDKSFIRLDFLQNTLAFLNMGLAGFVLAAVCARFVFTAVSAEGEAFWLLRSSPLGLDRFLWGKFYFFLVPVLVLAETLVICTNRLLDVAPFMSYLSSITMVFMVVGITGLGIGFGAMYPNFRYENIARVSTGFGGLMYMMVSALFIGVVIIAEAGPVYILFRAEVRGYEVSPAQWAFIVVSFGIAFAVCVVALITPMRMGIEALTRYE